MSRLEAPSEPSMEEILAQIRKIIADEPLQARAEHAQIAAQRRIQTPRPSPAPIPEQRIEPPVPALDSIARLESVLNSPAASLVEDDLSDLVEPSAPESATELAAPTAAPILASDTTEPLAPLPMPPEPVSDATAVASASAELEATPPAPVTVQSAQIEAPPAPAAEIAVEAEPVADAMETALDTLAAGLAAVSLKPVPEPDALPATEGPASPETSSVILPEQPMVEPVTIESATVEPVAEVEPQRTDELPQPACASASIETTPSMIGAVNEPATEGIDPTVLPPIAPAAEIPVALVEAEPAADVAADVALEPTAPSSAQERVSVIEPAQPVEAAAAFAPAAAVPVSASPIAQQDAATAAESAETSSNLDDTMADLLRPMLRQWLDENMPRIVEKALRVEMAQMRKPKK